VKAVGVKVLKDNLSKYLAMVSRGETILVTDRDEVIAEIRKPERLIPPSVSRWQAFLNQEEGRGSVRRALPGPVPRIDRLRTSPRPRGRIDVDTLLDEIRSD
jgi:antitoxin (DNA-binding transcriptional repressor) of toxin-antitoxin stability system